VTNAFSFFFLLIKAQQVLTCLYIPKCRSTGSGGLFVREKKRNDLFVHNLHRRRGSTTEQCHGDAGGGAPRPRGE